jgi:hypothetical protein
MNKKLESTNLPFIRFVVIFSLIFGLGGCKQSNLQFALSSPNCNPPCWQNIIPGKTTEEEVINNLKNNSIVDQKSITLQGGRWNTFDDAIYSLFKNGEIKSEIYFLNGKVALMTFSGDLNTTFNQAVTAFGDPEYIINIPQWGGLPGYPDPSFSITALNPSKGIKFSYDTRDVGGNIKLELTPENKITRISYFDPNKYKNILDAGMFSEGFLKDGEAEKFMVIWNGYGEIDKKYPPAIIP